MKPVLFLLFFSLSLQAANLRPFCSDGCSALVPSGTAQDPDLWLHCCVAHDLEYWAGGSRAEKRIADQELYRCVSQTGHQDMARLMYKGVRLAGYLFWGNGWGKNRFDGRGFKTLTDEEESLVQLYSPSDYSQVRFCKNTST